MIRAFRHAQRDPMDDTFPASVIDSVLWSYTRKKSRSRRFLCSLAQRFLDAFYDRSYDMRVNGEYDLLARLKHLKFNVLFDIGAHVGDWSVAAAEAFPGATIHAFEISPDNYQRTIAKLKGSRFVVNNVGLLDRGGTIAYKDYGPSSAVNTTVTDARFWDTVLDYATISGAVTTGDAYCHEHLIDFIDYVKIDVEGADHLVMLGLKHMIERQMIRMVQFEYGYLNGDAGFLMRDFFRFFESNGYIVGKLWSDGIDFSGFRYWFNEFRSGPNYVAVRGHDTELIGFISIKRDSVLSKFAGPRFKAHLTPLG